MQTFLDAMPMTEGENDRSLITSDTKPDRSTWRRLSGQVSAVTRNTHSTTWRRKPNAGPNEANRCADLFKV